MNLIHFLKTRNTISNLLLQSWIDFQATELILSSWNNDNYWCCKNQCFYLTVNDSYKASYFKLSRTTMSIKIHKSKYRAQTLGFTKQTKLWGHRLSKHKLLKYLTYIFSFRVVIYIGCRMKTVTTEVYASIHLSHNFRYFHIEFEKQKNQNTSWGKHVI